MRDYIAEDPVKPDWIYNEPRSDRTSPAIQQEDTSYIL